MLKPLLRWNTLPCPHCFLSVFSPRVPHLQAKLMQNTQGKLGVEGKTTIGGKKNPLCCKLTVFPTSHACHDAFKPNAAVSEHQLKAAATVTPADEHPVIQSSFQALFCISPLNRTGDSSPESKSSPACASPRCGSSSP